MRNYIIFLKKELFEAVKTYKLLILAATFFVFGLMSPLFAKMMPEIMKFAMASDPSTAGMDLTSLFADPAAIDAWIQFYSNVGQLGLIVLVIVFSGMLASEISKGTLTIILTKGLARSTAILAKFSSAVIIWTGCFMIAFFTSWGFTIYFFPGEHLPHILLAGFCLWVYGVFLLALTCLAATLTKSTIFCMLSVGAAVVVFSLLPYLPFTDKYNPAFLSNMQLRLLHESATVRNVMPTLISSLIIIIAFVLLAVLFFDRTKWGKKTAALTVLLAFSMVTVILLSEEAPARIQLSRYVITEKITIGAGTEWELAGKLTIPKKADGKVPAVVLVQGSGSSDMDETIFDNKPFKEIAEYLSANGIAVIRYNKRTYTHGLTIAGLNDGSFTVWDETIEDALLATKILKADPRIDADKVFILGHSLGGMLAPRIHTSGGDYAGLILFAGSPRFLLDIMKDQQALGLQAMEEGAEKEAAKAMNKEFIDSIEAGMLLSDAEAKDLMLPEMGGVSAYYFKDLHDHPPAHYIAGISAPFLVMQAANDLQVYIDKDFDVYKELLAGRDNATFRLYDGLNHLFMPSKVTDISELMNEYKIKANIDRQVLADIEEWIKAN